MRLRPAAPHPLVGRAHRLTVVKLEAVAQVERIGQFVVADLPGVDHLRLRTKVAVHAEQGVVDEIAEVAGDVDADELRIDDRQIGMRHEPQDLAAIALRLSREYGQGGQAEGDEEARRGHGHPYLLKAVSIDP